MFFMAEYANMVTASCIAVLLFLGGWEFLPFVSWSKLSAVAGVSIYEQGFWWLLPVAWFMAKVSFVLILFIWVRWTLPRFRYDQLMRLGWKKLIPLSLLNIVITMLIVMWVV